MKVGPHKPKGDYRHAIYIGPSEKLKGETALIIDDTNNTIIAQFDNKETGYGFGWWKFRKEYFEDLL